MNIEIKECDYKTILEIRHKVMWPNKNIDFVKVKNDDKAVHIGLYLDRKVVSIISLFEDGEELQFRKFATLKDYQGKGFGTQLLNYTLDYAKASGASLLWCNARLDAVPFYESLGLQTTCEAFYRDDQAYIIMSKVL